MASQSWRYEAQGVFGVAAYGNWENRTGSIALETVGCEMQIQNSVALQVELQGSNPSYCKRDRHVAHSLARKEKPVEGQLAVAGQSHNFGLTTGWVCMTVKGLHQPT